MDNLPAWDGAAVIYSRCSTITQSLCAAAFETQSIAAKKARRKNFRFSPPDEATAIIEAMKAGNEEAMKAAAYKYRHYWQ